MIDPHNDQVSPGDRFVGWIRHPASWPWWGIEELQYTTFLWCFDPPTYCFFFFCLVEVVLTLNAFPVATLERTWDMCECPLEGSSEGFWSVLYMWLWGPYEQAKVWLSCGGLVDELHPPRHFSGQIRWDGTLRRLLVPVWAIYNPFTSTYRHRL